MKAPISVTVNGSDLDGWLMSSVSRSIEDISGTFDLSLSLAVSEPLPVQRQDEVAIKINGHQVMAGYALLADPFYSRDDIGLQLQGRDYTGDLVVASALHGKGQWLNATVDVIARDLCKPFNINVVVEESVGQALSRFELEPGESVSEALARLVSYRGLLVTRNNAGQLLITSAGKHSAVGAIVRGANVISMAPAGSDADRHSEYIIQGMGEINHIGSARKAQQLKGHFKDKHLKRYLPLIVQADNSSVQSDLQLQAEHMARVRLAQAFKYSYTVDGWESHGKPWEINTLVPVYDEALGLDGDELLIVSTNATVSRDNADVTEIVVCPPEAFARIPLPQPKAPKKRSARKGRRKRDGLIVWR